MSSLKNEDENLNDENLNIKKVTTMNPQHEKMMNNLNQNLVTMGRRMGITVDQETGMLVSRGAADYFLTDNPPIKCRSLKNEDERRNESLNIIYQIKQQKLNSKHEAIRHLLELLTVYVQIGLGREINIPYPELNKTILGSLNAEKGRKCNIYLRDN
jgi:uncharacterized FlaG/YvyC family protein